MRPFPPEIVKHVATQLGVTEEEAAESIKAFVASTWDNPDEFERRLRDCIAQWNAKRDDEERIDIVDALLKRIQTKPSEPILP